MKLSLKDKYTILKAFLIACLILILTMTGGIINLTVLANNQGKMPVYTGYYFSEPRHFGFIYSNEVKLPYLSDVIKIETKEYEHYYSIGDLIMIFSLFLAIIFAVISIKNIIKIQRKLKRL